MADENKKQPLRLSDLQNGGPSGLTCRKCGCRDLRVSYTHDKPGSRQRVRFCRYCGNKIVTLESVI
jgi:hypothetical protein